jgi:hypothetical protein
MNNEQRKEVLRNIILLRMATTSQLEQCRFILEETGVYPEKRINILLDRLNNLNKLERELISKKI